MMKGCHGRDALLFLLSSYRRRYVYLNKYTFGNQEIVIFIVDYREVACRLLANLRFDLSVYAGMAYIYAYVYIGLDWKLPGSFRKFPGKFAETSKVSTALFPESFRKHLEIQKEIKKK